MSTRATSSLRQSRCITTRTPKYLQNPSRTFATPLPHPTAPGPPPKPPTPSASFQGERVARKRDQASLRQLGQQLKANPSKPSTTLQKRFWKNVSVQEYDDGIQIHLDARAVRTPSREILKLPRSKHHLAAGIALEWDHLVSAQQALKQHYIPLTSLAARALDIQSADAAGDSSPRDSAVQIVLGYLRTDTLLCWAPEKSTHDNATQDQEDGVRRGAETLRDRQMEAARPIVSFLTTHVWPGVELNPALGADSIVPTPQPEMTTQVIRGWVAGLPAFELAGLERGVLASKSLCVAARLVVEWSGECGLRAGVAAGRGGRFGIEEAAEACSQEVIWQTQMWGEVEDSHDVDKEDLRRQLGSMVMLVYG